MLASLSLPEGVVIVRTTPEFTIETVPPGLLGSHRVAPGVWGRLRVDAGSVTFVLEATGESRRLAAGEAQVIEPGVQHRILVGVDARFVIEFHRTADGPATGGETERRR